MIIWVAHYGAQLPGSSWPWPATPVAVAWLAVGALAAGLAMGWVLARPWLALAAGRRDGGRPAGTARAAGLAAARLACWWPATSGRATGWWSGPPPDAAVVVDAGPDPVPMRRCLDQLGVTSVPVLVLTHFHADHVDGLAGVLAGRTVGADLGQRRWPHRRARCARWRTRPRRAGSR